MNPIYIPGLILLLASFDDLLTRKVHNKLLLFFTISSLLSLFIFWPSPSEQFFNGMIACGLALLLTLPLAFVGALGGGDMKLLMVVGLVSSPAVILNTFLYSFIWGAVFVLLLALTRRDFFPLLWRTFSVFSLFRYYAHQNISGSPQKISFSIPFTIPLFFGWLTTLSLQGHIYLGGLQ